jgi:hypothetical protein
MLTPSTRNSANRLKGNAIMLDERYGNLSPVAISIHKSSAVSFILYFSDLAVHVRLTCVTALIKDMGAQLPMSRIKRASQH